MDVSSENTKCRMKLYPKRDRRAPLFVANFSMGRLQEPDRVTFKSYKQNSDSDNVGVSAKRQLVAKKDDAQLTYVSTSVIGGNSPMRYFVGVLDKNTGKMKLYDMLMFRMKPDIRVVSKPKPVEVLQTSTYRESMDNLISNFGTKQRKRGIGRKLTLNKNVESYHDITKVPKSSLNVSQSPGIKYLLPVNWDATKKSEAYAIEDIISPDEDRFLQQEADLLLSDTEEMNKKKETCCTFVRSRIDKANTQLKYLLYYDYLIIFQHLDLFQLMRREIPEELPNLCRQNMLRNFTQKSVTEKGQSRLAQPKQLKDKLLAHIVALALIIDDFQVNSKDIIADLKTVSGPSLITIAQAIGCRILPVRHDGCVQKHIILAIPLNVPKLKISRNTPKR